MPRSSTVYKLKESKIVLNKYVCGFCCERTTEDVLFHWRKCYGLWTNIGQKHWYKTMDFSKSVLMKKQTHLHLGWPEGEYIFRKF